MDEQSSTCTTPRLTVLGTSLLNRKAQKWDRSGTCTTSYRASERKFIFYNFGQNTHVPPLKSNVISTIHLNTWKRPYNHFNIFAATSHRQQLGMEQGVIYVPLLSQSDSFLIVYVFDQSGTCTTPTNMDVFFYFLQVLSKSYMYHSYNIWFFQQRFWTCTTP